MVLKRMKRTLQSWNIRSLKRSLVELNHIDDLRKNFNWIENFDIDEPFVKEMDGPLDANERRIRDAEVLASIARNVKPRACLEIGTAAGFSTTLIAKNAPQSRVYTLNASPEDISSGNAGNHTTVALEREHIGSYYRARGMTNIRQIYANSLHWKQNIEHVDLAFIDGCHDFDFVVSDTRKVIQIANPGCFILWHDFHLELSQEYDWIFSVCSAVGHLLRKKEINGPIFHLKNSWIGICRLPL